MQPVNEEISTTTTTETSHVAMISTACYDVGCLVHLSDKQEAYVPCQSTQRQPECKGKKTRWGEPLKEPRVHNEVRQYIVDLQEEMLSMADEVGLLKSENRELKKRVVMAEDASRKTEIEKECRR